MVYQHKYDVGDSVLVDMNGAQIPGVIEDVDGDVLRIRLAQPWVTETAEPSDTVSVHPDRVSPQLGSDGTPELPG